MINDLMTSAYCFAHRKVKELLHRSIEPDTVFEYCYDVPSVNKWYGENEVIGDASGSCISTRHFDSFDNFRIPEQAWADLVRRSMVPEGWKNSGLCNVCYNKTVGHWCLSSWIWTSAAVARYAALRGDYKRLLGIANSFLSRQHRTGGWVVRVDYINSTPSPMLAPNDSCYIASNALIPAYEISADKRYIESARACADWVMESSLSTGLVSTGFNISTGDWHNSAIIVDTGFTASLFADLVRITGETVYFDFLKSFTEAYVSAFRDPATGGFATSVDERLCRSDGRFSRGQAWALEGLIPAYKVLGDERLRTSIDGIVDFLIGRQDSDGGWAYDLSKPLLGQDCKGISVVAKSLAEWGRLINRQDCIDAAGKAIEWCRAHTDLEGSCPGGIFSFCMEGSISHFLYTEAMFVYSTVYALEVVELLSQGEGSGHGR